MLRDALFEKALGIVDPWFVTETKFDSEEQQLDIYIDFRKGSTFNYIDSEKKDVLEDCKVYDTEDKTWRHLNFFEYKCFIHCRTPRIKNSSGKKQLVVPPWAGLQNGFTLLFEALIVTLSKDMPVLAVSRIVKESDDKIWRLLNNYVDLAKESQDFSDVKSVGCDETSKKRRYDYVSLFIDLDERRACDVTEGKSHKTVIEFKETLEKRGGKAENITDFSCDMSPAFIKGIKENFPNAKITFDKFHIMKIINKAVDSVRKRECADQEILRGKKYLFLKNRDNLTEKDLLELERLESIENINLQTIRALHIRENFQELYKESSIDCFETMLNKWYYWATHSKIPEILKVAKTIKNHWDGIVQWKTSQINNGILEGLNSVIQAIKRRARGYRTFKNYKTMIFLAIGKLNFNALNKNIR